MATSVELREKRAGIVAEARKSWNDAEARDGGPAAEDKQAFDAAMDGADALLDQIKRVERIEAAEADLDAPAERQAPPVRTAEERGRRDAGVSDDRKRAAFRRWMLNGEVRDELRAESGRTAEYRDTVLGTDAKGGYLIAPTQISNDVVKVIQDQVFIRQLCAKAGAIMTVTSAKALGVRKMTSHMADANWTTEVAPVTEDTTMAFARRDLTPNLVSKLALVSINTLLHTTDAEAIIRDELGYKFGVTEEKAYISGPGSGQPLGIYTADANGITTDRDVTASSTTSFTGDDLINVKYNLKQAYMNDPSCAWIVSRAFVKAARKLKVASSTGGNDLQYIWQPGLTEGAPDRILDIPYYMSEYAPNTFTTGLYVAVLGCFRFYRIAQVQDLVIQRLVELYAATNQVGFIGRRWVDGSPILEEAFSRLKLA